MIFPIFLYVEISSAKRFCWKTAHIFITTIPERRRGRLLCRESCKHGVEMCSSCSNVNAEQFCNIRHCNNTIPYRLWTRMTAQRDGGQQIKCIYFSAPYLFVCVEQSFSPKLHGGWHGVRQSKEGRRLESQLAIRI